MRRNAFLEYLLAQVIVIASVLLIFRLVADRSLAATLAGILFVTLPPVLMFREYRRQGFKWWLWYFFVLQFWIVFALPILGIRLWNWGVPFDQLSFWGIPGQTLHQHSSKSYILMMAATVWFWIREIKKEKPT